MQTDDPKPLVSGLNIGPVFPYGEIILWERTVQHALEASCAEGSVVLDVGANIAGVAIALSRMVGATGQVHAFECNPRLAEWGRRNCLVNKAHNVHFVEKAVFSCSGKQLRFFCENSQYGHGSSLIVAQRDSSEISVVSVSIDDYCRENHLRPHAIKIDVEGGEYDVLAGALHVLRDCQPTVVFEDCGMHTQDRDPIDLLSRMGYLLYDASLYEPVDREFYQSRPGVANVLAIPPRCKARRGFTKQKISEHNGMEAIHLSKGLYVLECDIAGESTGAAWVKLHNIATGVDETMFETRLNWLKHHSCSALVFRAVSDAAVRVEVGSSLPIDGLRLTQVRVSRIDLI